jgi:hypothetical protein
MCNPSVFQASNLRGENAMQTNTLDKTIKARDPSMTEVERLMEAIAEAVKNEICAAKRAIEQDRRSTGDLVKDTDIKSDSVQSALPEPTPFSH